MPALNFKKQFAPLVKAGVKRQTIRAFRSRPFRKSDYLYLYTGMRTKTCEKLGETVAQVVSEITITEENVKINGEILSQDTLTMLALADGFDSVDEFYDFFRLSHGLPFHGQLIQWNYVMANSKKN
jgi:hypothetical protein